MVVKRYVRLLDVKEAWESAESVSVSRASGSVDSGVS